MATTAPAASMVIVPTILLSGRGVVEGLAALFAVLIAVTLVAFCLSQFTRRMVSPGGIYSFAFQGSGIRGALVSGSAILLKYFASASITIYHGSAAISAALGFVGFDVDASWKRVGVCVAVAAAIGVILIRGVRLAGLVILCVECVALTFIVFLMVFGRSESNPAMEYTHVSSSVPFWLVAVFALAGFESATFLGAEAKRPYVSVTRAVLWTPVLTGVLLIFAGWATLTGRADTVVEIYLHGSSSAHSGLVILALHVALTFSWIASAMASSNAASRVLFTMGIDRVVPRAFSYVHPRKRSPEVGILLVTALSGLGAVVYSVDTGAIIAHVQPVARLGFIVACAAVACAMLRFLSRIGELTLPVVLCAVAVLIASTVATFTILFYDHQWRSASTVVVGSAIFLLSAVWPKVNRRGVAGADRGLFDRVEPCDVLPGSEAYGLDGSGAVVLVASDSPSHRAEGN